MVGRHPEVGGDDRGCHPAPSDRPAEQGQASLESRVRKTLQPAGKNDFTFYSFIVLTMSYNSNVRSSENHTDMVPKYFKHLNHSLNRKF